MSISMTWPLGPGRVPLQPSVRAASESAAARAADETFTSRSNVARPAGAMDRFVAPVPAAGGGERGDHQRRAQVGRAETEVVLDAQNARREDQQREVEQVEEHRRLSEREDQAIRSKGVGASEREEPRQTKGGDAELQGDVRQAGRVLADVQWLHDGASVAWQTHIAVAVDAPDDGEDQEGDEAGQRQLSRQPQPQPSSRIANQGIVG